MRLALYLSAILASASPAVADSSSFPIDYPTCLGAIKQAAKELKLPLQFTVLNQDMAVYTIATTGGPVIMRCTRAAGTLTVDTPPGHSILPYVTGSGDDD